MKLSKAQQNIIDKAKANIDKARSMDYQEWLLEKHPVYRTFDDEYRIAISQEKEKEHYENERNGIVEITCNSRSLAKLKEMGIIEIIRDSKGKSYGIDIIKILNY